MSLAPGQPVRTRLDSGPGHTRLPGYARGRPGTVHALRGHYPFADEVARHGSAEPQALYSVRFNARDLWGEGAGDHQVYVDLYESYLNER
jgi:nitrile hydratase subunit beta